MILVLAVVLYIEGFCRAWKAASANAQDCGRYCARQDRRCRSGHHGPPFRRKLTGAGPLSSHAEPVRRFLRVVDRHRRSAGGQQGRAGPPGGPAGSGGHGGREHASNVLAKGLVRRPRPAGEVPSGPPPGPDAGYELVSVRARRCRRRLRHRRRAGNAGAGGGRRRGPGRERRALSVRHCRGMGVWRGRRDADAPVVAAAPVRARGRGAAPHEAPAAPNEKDSSSR